MKLGIMQPYLFPYLGYFDLIHRTDRWIVFDTAQYIRHGWVNRNRILHPKESWQYIQIPLQKHSRETPISEVHVSAQDWRGRIEGQMQHLKKKAPHWPMVMDLIRESFTTAETSISKINARALACVCDRLGIPFDCSFFSEMEMDLGPIEGPGDWALRICEAMGATGYLNPPGGEDLFDRKAFEASGIELEIQKYTHMEYECRGYQFIPGLSILDVMLWNTPEDIKRHLESL